MAEEPKLEMGNTFKYLGTEYKIIEVDSRGDQYDTGTLEFVVYVEEL